ncbi:MAG: glutaredoxin [Alphaproteobacteria bacterium]|nr:glutaredoxin [Alphaproteobacteria bacterium]
MINRSEAPPASLAPTKTTSARPVKILLYRWAGKWGPFKVNIPCGECTITGDIIRDTIENELAGIPVVLETRDWLSHWWRAMLKGGWHAPVVMVDGKVIAQGAALNRGVLAEQVVKAWVARSGMVGNHVFGKDRCGHCVRAKEMLDFYGIPFAYHDVVKNPRAVYEMVPRAKAEIGEKTPVTTPQIWLDGRYVGGADALEGWLRQKPSEARAAA